LLLFIRNNKVYKGVFFLIVMRKQQWLRIALIVVLLMLAFGAGYVMRNFMATAFAVQQAPEVDETPEVYSWTFALCTLGGRCMDVTAECNGTQVLNILSVTEIGGHDDGWQDPRGRNPSVCPWQKPRDNKN
jgi:hypothetical protein